MRKCEHSIGSIFCLSYERLSFHANQLPRRKLSWLLLSLSTPVGLCQLEIRFMHAGSANEGQCRESSPCIEQGESGEDKEHRRRKRGPKRRKRSDGN